MKLSKQEFINELISKSLSYGIAVKTEIAEKLYIYKELLVSENEKINLTAIVDDQDILLKHFVDSLIVAKYIKENNRIVDVGTGAGLPGMVLAIFFEGKINVCLIDAVDKKINFLKGIVEKLNLLNVECRHARAEDVAREEKYREKFDVAFARAVASANVLMELLSGYTKIDGMCVLLKSCKADEEISKCDKALKER